MDFLPYGPDPEDSYLRGFVFRRKELPPKIKRTRTQRKNERIVTPQRRRLDAILANPKNRKLPKPKETQEETQNVSDQTDSTQKDSKQKSSPPNFSLKNSNFDPKKNPNFDPKNYQRNSNNKNRNNFEEKKPRSYPNPNVHQKRDYSPQEEYKRKLNAEMKLKRKMEKQQNQKEKGKEKAFSFGFDKVSQNESKHLPRE